MTNAEVLKVKEKIILNFLSVLLKRGIHGLYIYVVNENLQKNYLNFKKKEMKIMSKINKSREERDWGQLHNEKDLTFSISLEASELLEIFK